MPRTLQRRSSIRRGRRRSRSQSQHRWQATEEPKPFYFDAAEEPVAPPIARPVAQPAATRVAQPAATRVAQPAATRVAQPAGTRVAQPADQWALPASVHHSLGFDPAFRIFTKDHMRWVCPYTCQLVPIHQDWLDSVRLHLISGKPWLRNPPLASTHLREAAWKYDCVRLLRSDKRMRLFVPQTGHWINPYTAQPESSVRLGDGVIDKRCMLTMIRCLAKKNAAEVQDMYAMEDLQSARLQQIHLARREKEAQEKEAAKKQQREQVLIAARKRRFRFDEELPGYHIACRTSAEDSASPDFRGSIRVSWNQQLVVTGRVEGHRGEASLLAAMAIKMARHGAKHHRHLKDFARFLHEALRHECMAHQRIALAAVFIDNSRHACSCVSLGHAPLLLVDRVGGGRVRTMTRSNPSINSPRAGTEQHPLAIKTVSLSMPRGCGLVIPSNGLLDLENASGHPYGSRGAAASILGALSAGPDALAEGVLHGALHHAGHTTLLDQSVLTVQRTQ